MSETSLFTDRELQHAYSTYKQLQGFEERFDRLLSPIVREIGWSDLDRDSVEFEKTSVTFLVYWNGPYQRCEYTNLTVSHSALVSGPLYVKQVLREQTAKHWAGHDGAPYSFVEKK